MPSMKLEPFYITVKESGAKAGKATLTTESKSYSLVTSLRAMADKWSSRSKIYDHPINGRDQFIYFDSMSTIGHYAHEFKANCSEKTTAAPVIDLGTKETTYVISTNEATFPYSYFQVRHKEHSNKALLCCLKVGRTSHREIFWRCLKETFKSLHPGFTLEYHAVVSKDLLKQYINSGVISNIEFIGNQLPKNVEALLRSTLAGSQKDYSFRMSIIPHDLEKAFRRTANDRIGKYFDGGMVPSEVFAFTDPYTDLAVDVIIGGRNKRIVLSKAGMKGIDIELQLGPNDIDVETGMPTTEILRRECDDIANEYFA